MCASGERLDETALAQSRLSVRRRLCAKYQTSSATHVAQINIVSLLLKKNTTHSSENGDYHIHDQ